MTTISKPLVVAGYAPNAETTVYTVPASTRTLIDKISVYNGTGGSVIMTIRYVPSGGSAGASNAMASKAIAAGVTETFSEITGQTLGSGESVSVLAGAATSLVYRITAREVT